MKISLNWIFDHIDGDVQSVDVAKLVNTFIKTTAEIDAWHHVSFDVERFTLVQVTAISDTAILAHSPEHKKDYNLSVRADAVIGSWYIIECNTDQPAWANINSIGGTKDALLPAFFVEEKLQSGGWKNTIELSDCVLDIDNKSINHRPDLWSHRGLAREIAAILDLPLKKLDIFLADQDTEKTTSFQGRTGQFSVAIESDDVCKRFCALSVESIEVQPSNICMAMRLGRLDSRAIDFVVDSTNYVMLDLGQPMHAFDANLLTDKNIIVRRGRNKEKLTLLDGETIELSSHDIVIADKEQVVSLAGIMGGAATGVNAKTRSLLLEAANFDAATVRRTAARYKKRTEASMRFEKSLDPNHIDNAILRFLFLLDTYNISYKTNNKLLVLGNKNPIITIDVAHARIEQILGVTVSSEQVSTILEKLSFDVERISENNELHYKVTVPSFRATKDIKIAEDIIEEIGRYIGYDSIEQIMPLSRLVPSDLHTTYAIRKIKRLLSNGLLMRELYGYSFFDESFLRTLAWEPQEAVEIKNPISENYIRLVTTLQPHLLKAVGDNSIHHTQLRFYEWGRVWRNENNEISEKKSVSGIFFEQNRSLDFYEGKLLVSRLFKELACEVSWEQNDNNSYPWLSAHQTARIMHNGVYIGVAGMVTAEAVNALSAAGGTAFMFECDGDYLINYKHPTTHFIPLPKYPAVNRDVSMMVPLAVMVGTLIDIIKKADSRIRAVSLIDFFTKSEWKDQKSVTFHIEMRDDNKTLEHDEVETVWNKVVALLEQQGAVIR